MDLTITADEKNALLGRREIKGKISFAGPVPSGADLAAEIAKYAKSKDELVVIKGIYTAYGGASADIAAYVYDSVEDKAKLEMKTKHLKEQEKKLAEEATKAKEDAAKAAEEAPAAEEKAEETSSNEVAEAPKEDLSGEPAEAKPEEEPVKEEAKEEAAPEEAPATEPKEEEKSE